MSGVSRYQPLPPSPHMMVPSLSNKPLFNPAGGGCASAVHVPAASVGMQVVATSSDSVHATQRAENDMRQGATVVFRIENILEKGVMEVGILGTYRLSEIRAKRGPIRWKWR